MPQFFKQEKNGIIICLILVLIIGSSLRFYKAGSQSLWTDEISGAVIASSKISEIFSRNLSPDKADIPVEEPPLQYILMHYSMKLSENEFMIRLPSVLFGILSILAIFLVARLFYGNSTALLSSFLLSISLYHILYSQEARGYSAHIFFSLLSFFFMWKAATRGDIRSWIGFSFSTTLNIYSHYSAFQVFAVESLIFFLLLSSSNASDKGSSFLRYAREKIKGYSLSIVIIGVLVLPLLKNFVGVMGARLGGTTIPFEFNLQYFANLLARYGAGNGIPFYIYNIFFLLGIVWAFVSNKKKELIAMVLWMAFPFAVLAFTGYKYFFHIRYVIFTFPIYLIIVANGAVGLYESKTLRQIIQKIYLLGRVRLAWIYGTAYLALFGSLSITPLHLYYQMPARMADWKGVAAYIKEHYEPGTLILTESAFIIRELGYYLKDTKPRIEVYSVHGDINRFKEIGLHNDKVWYVDGNPVFDSVVQDLFKDRVVFGSPVFAKLGKRELIDWDKSWFPESNIRRYYPILYYNNIHGYLFYNETARSGNGPYSYTDKEKGNNPFNISKWQIYVPENKDYSIKAMLKPKLDFIRSDFKFDDLIIHLAGVEGEQLISRSFKDWYITGHNSSYTSLRQGDSPFVSEGLSPYTSMKEKGMELLAMFDGDGEEDEYLLLGKQFKNISLKENPYLAITYQVEDPSVQTVQMVFGVKTKKRGDVWSMIIADASYPRPASTRPSIFILNAYEEAKRRFPDDNDFYLTRVEILPHKIWNVDCSTPERKKNYRFILYDFQLLRELPPPVLYENDIVKNYPSTNAYYYIQNNRINEARVPENIPEGVDVIYRPEHSQGFNLQTHPTLTLRLERPLTESKSEVNPVRKGGVGLSNGVKIVLDIDTNNDGNADTIIPLQVPSIINKEGHAILHIPALQETKKAIPGKKSYRLVGMTLHDGKKRWKYWTDTFDLTRYNRLSYTRGDFHPRSPVMRLGDRLFRLKDGKPLKKEGEGYSLEFGPISLSAGDHSIEFPENKKFMVDMVEIKPVEDIQSAVSGRQSGRY